MQDTILVATLPCHCYALCSEQSQKKSIAQGIIINTILHSHKQAVVRARVLNTTLLERLNRVTDPSL